MPVFSHTAPNVTMAFSRGDSMACPHFSLQVKMLIQVQMGVCAIQPFCFLCPQFRCVFKQKRWVLMLLLCPGASSKMQGCNACRSHTAPKSNRGLLVESMMPCVGNQYYVHVVVGQMVMAHQNIHTRVYHVTIGSHQNIYTLNLLFCFIIVLHMFLTPLFLFFFITLSNTIDSCIDACQL